MISLVGRTAILAALAAFSAGAVTGFMAAIRRSRDALRWSRWMAWAGAAAVVVATLAMEYALLTHDFSVSYVAEVGSRSSPTWVTIVSLWSSLNGSILLWAFILGVYLAAFAWSTRHAAIDHQPWALGVAHVVGMFFAFLVAGVANPFEPVSPVPADGPGPNPLLQNHILMVIHPPALYLGFVGMTIPFAMGATTLFAARTDAAWIRSLRRWMLVPWGFLTVGIVLGGWWSYEVLGWGGWWAWDPVENASFLPWLTATAFVHSIIVTERKDQLKGWSLTLVLATFLLTILGTFMTRSGVFNSVHAFTQSPIGPVFLAFLAIALVFSVLLLAARVDALAPGREGLGGPASRETGFLLNNLLFTAFTFTVLLGTVFPLVNESLTGKQVSVGEPYFNRFGAPLGLIIVFLMAIGPALPWGRSEPGQLLRRLVVPAAVGLVTVGACLALGLDGAWPLATFGIAAMALVETLQEFWIPARVRARARGESMAAAIAGVVTRARRRYGGYVVHIGVIMIVVAHAAAMAYTSRATLTFRPGQAEQVGDVTLTYQGARVEDQGYRLLKIASFAVQRDGRPAGVVEPRLNIYRRMGQPIGTPAVRSRLDEDLYVSLVNLDMDDQTASVDVLVRPLVWWLWFGGGVMVLGTLVALWPRRRRVPAAARVPAGAAAETGR